jgi:hypothetical protein
VQLAAVAFADDVIEERGSAATGSALADAAGLVRPIRSGKLEGAAEAMLDWASRKRHRSKRARK